MDPRLNQIVINAGESQAILLLAKERSRMVDDSQKAIKECSWWRWLRKRELTAINVFLRSKIGYYGEYK